MRTPTHDIRQLILTRLATSEVRLLNLVVSVRERLNERGGYGGDLTRAVRQALRELIRTRRIIDADGAYSLARHPPAD